MDRSDITSCIVDNGIIAIIRGNADVDVLLQVIAALAEGEVCCIEVTMNSPGALECIERASEKFRDSDVLLGVGTVHDAETCRKAIEAGAQYVVSPIVSKSVIEMAHHYDKPVLPGAFTPTEIHTAWELGGDLIKLFPNALGGLEYLRAVRGPFKQIPLVPTGGVKPENIKDYFEAGAVAVGVGGGLVNQQLIEDRDFNEITCRARSFVKALNPDNAKGISSIILPHEEPLC